MQFQEEEKRQLAGQSLQLILSQPRLKAMFPQVQEAADKLAAAALAPAPIPSGFADRAAAGPSDGAKTPGPSPADPTPLPKTPSGTAAAADGAGPSGAPAAAPTAVAPSAPAAAAPVAPGTSGAATAAAASGGASSEAAAAGAGSSGASAAASSAGPGPSGEPPARGGDFRQAWSLETLKGLMEESSNLTPDLAHKVFRLSVDLSEKGQPEHALAMLDTIEKGIRAKEGLIGDARYVLYLWYFHVVLPLTLNVFGGP